MSADFSLTNSKGWSAILVEKSPEKILEVSMVKTVSVQDHQIKRQAKRKAPIAKIRNKFG
jgi:hypothetical protein